MRALAWTGLEEWLAEHAQVDVGHHGIMATGVQLGVEPEPYLLEYRLDAPSEWITRRLEVEASGAGWRRSLSLEHDGRGRWTADGERRPELPRRARLRPRLLAADERHADPPQRPA